MPDAATLLPATTAELEQALAHALRFDGNKTFRPSGEMMARITVAAACLTCTDQLSCGREVHSASGVGFLLAHPPLVKLNSIVADLCGTWR